MSRFESPSPQEEDPIHVYINDLIVVPHTSFLSNVPVNQLHPMELLEILKKSHLQARDLASFLMEIQVSRKQTKQLLGRTYREKNFPHRY